MVEYTKEQIKDITDREKKGLEALRTLELTPAISMQMAHIGNDVFGIKPMPYLADTKYASQISPIQTKKSL